MRKGGETRLKTTDILRVLQAPHPHVHIISTGATQGGLEEWNKAVGDVLMLVQRLRTAAMTAKPPTAPPTFNRQQTIELVSALALGTGAGSERPLMHTEFAALQLSLMHGISHLVCILIFLTSRRLSLIHI